MSTFGQRLPQASGYTRPRKERGKRCMNSKILIVEDSYLLARTLEDMLSEAGANVVAIAPSVAIALKEIERHAIDVACLDIDLGCETSFPIADALAMRGIPFVFVSACDSGVVPPAHRHRPFVSKVEAHLTLVSACQAAAPSAS
jgi:CheY-like chemotaxis protein